MRGDHVFASVLGSKAITASPSADSLPVLTISRAGATSSVPIIPSVGSVVTGRVTAITARAATVQIQVIDGVAVSHPFAGTLRQENLSLTDIDRTAMENCVRPGDVILAEVRFRV